MEEELKEQRNRKDYWLHEVNPSLPQSSSPLSLSPGHHHQSTHIKTR